MLPIKTHPSPVDRIYKLLDVYKEELFIEKENIEKLIQYLQNHIECNFDTYEMYGSIYLGSWRGKVKKDRMDY